MNTYRYNKLRLDVEQATKKLTAKEAQRDLLIKQREAAEKAKAAAEAQLEDLDKIQILLQKASDYARQQIKTKIEDTVSQALNVVYGDGHKFIIDLVVRSNRPEVDYWLNDGEVLTKLEKPDFDRGGGKIDVICLSYKLAIAELMLAPGPLFLDEVGKHVDGEAALNVAYFLRNYSQNFNRQILLITHNEDLAAIGDVSHRVTKKNAKAKVERLA